MVKSTVEISQNFVAFSEYMNFNIDEKKSVVNKEKRIVNLVNPLSKLLRTKVQKKE